MIATDVQLDLVRAALLSRPRSIAELAAVLDVATQRGRDSADALANAAEDALAYLRAEAVPSDAVALAIGRRAFAMNASSDKDASEMSWSEALGRVLAQAIRGIAWLVYVVFGLPGLIHRLARALAHHGKDGSKS